MSNISHHHEAEFVAGAVGETIKQLGLPGGFSAHHGAAKMGSDAIQWLAPMAAPVLVVAAPVALAVGGVVAAGYAVKKLLDWLD